MFKQHKLCAYIFVITIMYLMCSVLLKVSSIQSVRMQQEIWIDWEKLYPFEVQEEKYTSSSRKSKLYKLYSYVKQKVWKYSTTELHQRFQFVGVAKKYEDIIGWNFASFSDYNGVVKLAEDYLASYTASKDTSKSAGAFIDLGKFCRNAGIEYLYVNYPGKICIYEDANISGILDFSNQNTDSFLQRLEANGIRYYDMRKALHDDGLKHHQAFFRTDHHWKPETGLWAARHILQFMRDFYGLNTKPEMLVTQNFKYVIYPDWFLGSQGKKVTLLQTKPEDFTLIYPKFDTQFRFEVPVLGIDVSGDFSVTYDMKHVETKDYYNTSPYLTYKYGDRSLTRIHNLLNNDGVKVLFIHDSMSDCVVPFIALGIETTESIDLRFFTGSIMSYIKSSRPDVVISAY